ncbi:alpha/beta fold hydrolase [Hoyosella altamirensis]|uniref:Pimeloyl-ACP methyl ester carboxylesterase n=1 Tax=Hoyosella altamirensis TaxID=616997 RepID=A0A839RM71_9ACTN|nr:alpha/beta fold hydrolase [Hoyosella altamirensis]MBB3037176.1 pimeloyl-ACP methyl ester carboxylesterase [Hoyosella altamirensis]
MDLAYQIYGEGPTLVLVHGVVHRQQAWSPVIAKLAEHRRVVTVDLPGHGLSPQLGEGDNAAHMMADILERFVDEVTPHGERAHIAGNSLGGWLSLELAARGAVASATALSPAGFWVNSLDERRTVETFRSLRFVSRLLSPVRLEVLRNPVVRGAALAPFFSRPWRISPEDAAADAASLANNVTAERVAESDFTLSGPIDSSVPVTVQWGGLDFILPVYQALRVRGVFPHARLVVMPFAGHVPMNDVPDAVVSVLLEGSSAASATESQHASAA